MNIDFHSHGKLTKYLPFSQEYTLGMFRQARRAGLDALCLTEHFNTRDFLPLYRFIGDNFPTKGDARQCEGLLVFAGLEIEISEGGHILAVGPWQKVLALGAVLAPHGQPASFLPFEQLLRLAGDSLLLGAAHPFRPGSRIPCLDTALLRRLDFIDLNGKDCAEPGEDAARRTRDFAEELDLPVVAGSDTHQSCQYGCVYNSLQEDCQTIVQLRHALRLRAFTVECSSNAAFQVRSAGLIKRALKQVDALGGDYLQVLAEK